MLGDGLKDLEHEEVQQLDLAEILLRSVGAEESATANAATK